MGVQDTVQEVSLEQDDEITSLLLRHERQQKGNLGQQGWSQEDSDSDNRSDESDVDADADKDGVDRDAALLAATFAGNDDNDVAEEVEEMDDDSGEDDDIPTIKVGGEEYDITDVTTEIIAKMTTEEMEKYNQLYQDFYRDMYD